MLQKTKNCAVADEWEIKPSGPFNAVLRVPGDKSISHRVALLAGLSEGISLVEGFLDGEDCLCTVAAMEAMGAAVRRNGTVLQITGTGGKLNPPAEMLDLGNSGTSMRLLAGLAAGCHGRVALTGDASLCSRPMRRIAEPLAQMGVRVEFIERDGYAPLAVHGGKVQPLHYCLPVASAQVKSCVMLAGLWADGVTVVEEPSPCRDHTERAFIRAGLPCEVAGSTITVKGCAGNTLNIPAMNWRVPGDFSSAAFWVVAAAAQPGAQLRIDGVGLNPRRTALLDILRRMGAEIETVYDDDDSGELSGSIIVRGTTLHGTEIGGAEIPNAIDEIPVLTVAAALAGGVTEIRDAAELRVKESDRIAVMAANLQLAGVAVEVRPDGMRIVGAGRPAGGCCFESHGDHRVAMSMAVLGTYAKQPVVVRNAGCAATSYPGFMDTLDIIVNSQN